MADSDKNIRITTNKNKATVMPNIVFTGASAGTSVLTLEVRDDNTVAFTGADGDVFSLDYNLSTGTIWSVNDKSGTPLLRASAGGTIGIAELGSGVLVGIGQTNPKYKLDVQGWAGFASTGDGSYTILVENGLTTGNNALSIRAANALRFYNSGNTLFTGFIGVQAGVNTTYTLPARTPTGTGTSYLSSSIDGVMAWVAAPTSGGSGSVNSGTATYAAFYATTTNAVSENSNLQFTGTGVSIGGRINSTSITSGSFYVYGGVGITGNAFIGGTAYIPSTTPSNISNLLVSNNTATTTTSSGALVVSGGLGLAGNAFIGGTIYIPSTTASNFSNLLVSNNTSSTSTSTGALVVTGGLGIAGNAFIGGTFVQQNNTSSVGTNSGAVTIVGGVGIAGNAFIGGTFVQQNSTSSVGTNSGAITVAGGVGIAGNAFIGGTATIQSTQATLSASSGAMVVIGGAAVGQTLSVGGSLNIFNAANYTGFRFAGSANTTYTLPPRTPTGTGTSYLSSSIDGIMAWVAAPTGGGSGVINSAEATSIAYYSAATTISGTTVASNIYFQYTGDTKGLVVANVDAEFNTTSGSTKLLTVGTGATDYSTARKTLAVISTNNPWTNGDLLILGVGKNPADVRLGVDWRGYVTLGTPGTGFTLPILNGTSGQVLTANTNGVASWTTVTGSSSSGGTVYAGTANQIAFYGSTGNTVEGSATFTNNTSTGIARITHTTPSTSTSTGALVVDGSVGVGGSLYIGGQINQTYQPLSGAALDHAIFLQSNPVPTSIGSLIQVGSANKWDGTTAGFFTGSFSGTYIGINAASGNTADYINFQENGRTVLSVGYGGTNIQFGSKLNYAASDVLASFASSVTNYNQLIIQNLSKSTSASADFVINNDISTDTTFYGNFGMNSSTFTGTGALSAANAVYLTSTSGPLVLGSTTQHPIRILTNGSTTDLIYIHESGTAISVFTNFDLRAQNDLRFFNATNSNFAALQASNVTTNYTLSLPTATVGAGASVLVTGSDSNMYFAAPGSGIAFSSATANTPIIRAKRPLNLQFASGFTPVSAGPDSAILRVPESATDGTTSLTYNLRRFQVRVETPSAGSSVIQLEKSSTDTGAFTLAATGSSYLGGTGASIAGAGIYLTSSTFASGTFVTSGNLLRLNWTTLNATHANFSVNLLLEEV